MFVPTARAVVSPTYFRSAGILTAPRMSPTTPPKSPIRAPETIPARTSRSQRVRGVRWLRPQQIDAEVQKGDADHGQKDGARGHAGDERRPRWRLQPMAELSRRGAAS